jgi:y4mF family transcriptional regulator
MAEVSLTGDRHERAYSRRTTVDERVTKLAAQVRERRRVLKLTQDQLADLAGCSARFVRSLEAAKPGIRLDKLLDVATVLGLELELHPRGRRG